MEILQASNTTTDGTEQTILDSSEPGLHELQINLANLGGGATPDIVRLKAYTKTSSGGSYALVSPEIDLQGGLATGIFTMGPFTSAYGCKWTITRLQGTDRNYVHVVVNRDPHIYIAEVEYNVDATDSQDEYTVAFYRNGVQLAAASITSPTITVTQRDATVLINARTLTQVTAKNFYKYNATATSGAGSTNERQSAGECAAPQVAATIDGTARSSIPIRFIVRDR